MVYALYGLTEEVIVIVEEAIQPGKSKPTHRV
jgi:hypothetical protein